MNLSLSPVILYGATTLLVLIAGMWLSLFIQHRRHKAPLKAIDPNVDYSYGHHLKIVTWPLLRYRFHAKFHRSKASTPPQAKPTT